MMYTYFNGSDITPAGWLREQLLIQARGLSGHLDKIWPDIRDSAWIGGDREGWERVPYWLDGFIPMAYLLRDEDLIGRAKKYMDAIMERQQEDGWLCPCSREERGKYDIWSLFLIGKVLALYAVYSGDKRAEETLYRAFFNAWQLLDAGEIALFDWGRFRWFEALIPLYFLKQKKSEPWMDKLARLLQEQGTDYTLYEKDWKRPLNKWTLETHIVNLMMMLKYPALAKECFGLDCHADPEEMWQLLEKYNGTAAGIFTGDECLSGISPVQGTELCSVVELMYSCEQLFALTGDGVWLDRLEKAAFNALPATFTDDMCAHQYDQMANQIACITFPGKAFFRTNGKESHLFGLEPNFGCCTANFSQGWPKLIGSLYCCRENEICAVLPLPGELNTVWNGERVRIVCESEYPFRLNAVWRVQCGDRARFALRLRKPGWAKSMRVNGEVYTEDAVLERDWQGESEIRVVYEDEPHLTDRPGEMKTAELGPLVFALPVKARYRMLEYERDNVERKHPYCDYELIPESDWAYAFADEGLTVNQLPGDDIPFSSAAPRVSLTADMVPVRWGLADGYEYVAAPYPQSRQASGQVCKMELVPYGCAKLRMTEMPVVSRTC